MTDIRKGLEYMLDQLRLAQVTGEVMLNELPDPEFELGTKACRQRLLQKVQLCAQ